MKYHFTFRWYLLLTWMLLCFSTSTVRAQNINKLEYFVDVDPGFGLGINVPVTPAVDVTTFSDGFTICYNLVKIYETSDI